MHIPSDAYARGVVPKKSRDESVIRNPDAAGWFIFIDLAEGLDAAATEAFLRELHIAAEALRAERGRGNRRRATAAIAVSPTFFTSASGVARVAPPGGVPAGLATPLTIPNTAPAGGDLLVYLMATAEEVAARFLQRLNERRPSPIAALRVERGFQRIDGREWFGYRDGVRNVAPEERDDFVWTDPDLFPEEPPWTAGGTYLAYMKIRQNLQVQRTLPADALDQTIGRRADGTRLDLAEGTATADEPPDTAALPAASHVRKAGPRGDGRDPVRIFRRGLPYQEMTPDGLHVGLQFVSFQPSADYFKVILTRWMINNDFPVQQTGQDALIARGLVSFEKAGLYFVLPNGPEFVGQPMFAQPEVKPVPKQGTIAIRKRVLSAEGAEVQRDLAGFKFRILDSAGQPADDLVTNAAGHAQSKLLATGVTYTIEEIDVPAGVTADPLPPVALTAPHFVVQAVNRAQPGSPYAG